MKLAVSVFVALLMLKTTNIIVCSWLMVFSPLIMVLLAGLILYVNNKK